MNDCLSRPRAPRAARRPLSTIHHGIARMDDYAWLRAANWQAVMRDPAQLDPAIRAHLEAENAYAEAFMADTKELQALRIAGVAHSPDHSLIAYAVDTKGSEFYTVNVIEADGGAVVDSGIADNNGSLEWAADSRTLLYVWLDEDHRPRRVLRHAIGADGADDLIHAQDDASFFLGLSAT